MRERAAYVGALPTKGRAVLVGGTVTVTTKKATATANIMLTTQVPGGTVGHLHISARTPGTSFTILSSSGADTSTVGYEITEPAA